MSLLSITKDGSEKGFLPKWKPSDGIKVQWVIGTRGLEERTYNNFEDAKKYFQEKDITLDETPDVINSAGGTVGYTVYKRVEDIPSKAKFPVAYECGECKKVIVGIPTIEDFDSIRHEHPLSGSQGYEINCGHCNATLERIVTVQS